MGSRLEASHQEEQAMVGSLELSASPSILLEEERAEDLINDRACLYDEAFIRIPKVWDLESFLVGKHMCRLEEWYIPTQW